MPVASETPYDSIRSAQRRHSLDLEDDGQDHRPSPGTGVDELPESVVEVLLDQLQLADTL